MKHCLFSAITVLGVSNCCVYASPEIRLPPFLGSDRKGSYDVEIKRTEVFTGEVYSPLEGNFHVDVTDNSARVVSKRLIFTIPTRPKFQSEKIYSNRNHSLLTINTDDGKKPSRVDYTRQIYADDVSLFYSGFHGLSVLNGVFENYALDGSLWNVIRMHPDEVIANKSVLPQGVGVDLMERQGYWLLRCVRIKLDKSQRQLSGPQFYNFSPPSESPQSSTERLDCEYGPDDREQNYRYEISCKYEKGQTAGVRMEIAVRNYQPVVATAPLSDDGVYTPTLVTIPNGTEVGVVGEDKIDYMWQDGRIVKRIDGTAIDVAESVFFTRGSRFFMVACSLVVTLVLVALWIVRSRRKASS